MLAFVLLGVSGSRLSTVGIHIAARLSWPYLEEDDFYPRASLKKLYEGRLPADVDRTSAIDALGRGINSCMQPCIIAACSALTQPLRRRLESAVLRPIHFMHLNSSAERLGSRPIAPFPGLDVQGSMPIEAAIEIDASGGIDVVTSRVVSHVRAMTGIRRL